MGRLTSQRAIENKKRLRRIQLNRARYLCCAIRRQPSLHMQGRLTRSRSPCMPTGLITYLTLTRQIRPHGHESTRNVERETGFCRLTKYARHNTALRSRACLSKENLRGFFASRCGTGYPRWRRGIYLPRTLKKRRQISHLIEVTSGRKSMAESSFLN